MLCIKKYHFMDLLLVALNFTYINKYYIKFRYCQHISIDIRIKLVTNFTHKNNKFIFH